MASTRLGSGNGRTAIPGPDTHRRQWMRGGAGRREAAAAVSFFAAVLILVGLRIRYPFLINDEGFANYNAMRILNGEMPFRDFWSVYPAGQLYALALVFKIWGANLLASRVYDTVIKFIVVTAMFLIYRRNGSKVGAYAAAGIAALLIARTTVFSSPIYPAFGLGLLAVLTCTAYLRTGGLRWILAAGVCTGAASLFRWDFALYSALAVLGTVLFVAREWDGEQGGNWRSRGKAAFCFAAGAGAALPVWGWWAGSGGAANVLQQVFVFQILVSPPFRRLPYPDLLGVFAPISGGLPSPQAVYLRLLDVLAFYGTIIVYVAAAAYLLVAGLRRKLHFTLEQAQIFPLLGFGVLLFLQAANRFDTGHVLPSLLIAIMLLCLFLEHETRLALAAQQPLRWVAVAVPTLVLMLYLSQTLTLVSGLAKYAPLGCYSGLDRSGCIAITSDQEQAANYLLAHTTRNEKIYVGNTRHDAFVISDAGLYFLADRPAATHMTELNPGVITTAAFQTKVISELETQHIHYVALVDLPTGDEPNLSSVSSGAHQLDQYIRAAFHNTQTFGDYQIWER